jgi:hypothetical protein
MSSLRKMEREIVRSKCYAKNGNTGKFNEEWKNYRAAKFGEQKAPVNTMPKKKRHMDKAKDFINALRYQKMMIQNYINQKKAESETKESAAEAN